MDLDMDLRDDLGNQSDDPSGDGEGVWSPDIEQCFREALLLFPPCGRRKHILQEEGGGKMYGRNELIARHIMMRTGKRRTRKQVSSHIQVLARRKAKADGGGGGGASGSSAGVSPSPSNNMANLVVASRPSHPNNMGNPNNLSPSMIVGGGGGGGGIAGPGQAIGTNNRLNEANQQQQQQQNQYDVWLDRPIVTQKIRLVEFSAFVEYNSASHQFSQQPDMQMVPDLNLQLQQQNLDGAHMTHLQPHALGPNGHHQQQQNYQLPLTSNHHLPAQFNNANSYQANQANSLVHAPKLSITANSNSSSIVSQISGPSHHLNHQALQMQQQPQQTQHQLASAGSIRHSYIKINYTQQQSRQVNKLERIDINQIQDKFPEISGPDGLFQRGPPDAFFLVKFWADLNNDYEYNINDQNSFFGFSSHFETIDSYRVITCSTKACSYGLQVIEKVEKIYGCFNNSNGRYSYDMNRSPMCEFMIHFIRKLRQLPQASQMNSVLENFTVLQVITSESTSEILLCLAYVFEVAMEGHITGPKYNVYKLTKD